MHNNHIKMLLLFSKPIPLPLPLNNKGRGENPSHTMNYTPALRLKGGGWGRVQKTQEIDSYIILLLIPDNHKIFN